MAVKWLHVFAMDVLVNAGGYFVSYAIEDGILSAREFVH